MSSYDKAMTVFIAGPHTKGDACMNVRAGMDMYHELADLGFAPYCHLLVHFQHIVHPRSYGDWLELGFVWLDRCHCVFRLSGASDGADAEVARAQENGMPVFYDIPSLLEWRSENLKR